MAGKGCTIEDLRPVPGSPADGEAGAYARIYELLGISGVRDHIQEWLFPAEIQMPEDDTWFTITGKICRPGRHAFSGVYLKSSNTGAVTRIILR